MRILLLTGCVSSASEIPVKSHERVTARLYEQESSHIARLDGLVVPGKIRARGIVGIVSVRGTLSFREWMLVWQAQGDEEQGPYSVTEQDGILAFHSEYLIENDEQVRWSGTADGQTVSDVTVIWTRVKGDAVHDLLLPDQVTLDFTPDK